MPRTRSCDRDLLRALLITLFDEKDHLPDRDDNSFVRNEQTLYIGPPFRPITYQTLPSRNAPRATILCYSCAVITDHGRTRNTSRPTGLTNVRATNAHLETKTLPTKTQ